MRAQRFLQPFIYLLHAGRCLLNEHEGDIVAINAHNLRWKNQQSPLRREGGPDYGILIKVLYPIRLQGQATITDIPRDAADRGVAVHVHKDIFAHLQARVITMFHLLPPPRPSKTYPPHAGRRTFSLSSMR